MMLESAQIARTPNFSIENFLIECKLN